MSRLLFSHAEAVEDAVHHIGGDLSAIELSELAHSQLKLCAGGVRAQHIKGIERVFRMLECFTDGGKLAGIGDDGVIGSGEIATFERILNAGNERFAAGLILRRDENGRNAERVFNVETALLGVVSILLCKVALIAHGDDGGAFVDAALHVGEDFFILKIERTGKVKDGEHELRYFGELLGLNVIEVK